MRKATKATNPVEVIVGLAAEHGAGLAYATLVGTEKTRTLRVPFTYTPAAGLDGRDAAYAALTAVAGRLLDASVAAAHFTIADPRLGVDLVERRTLPAALTLPYVTLRCRLNRFRSHAIESAAPGSQEESRLRDLTARARAEVSLHVAA